MTPYRDRPTGYVPEGCALGCLAAGLAIGILMGFVVFALIR
jgi:hypothetical protein